MEVKVEMEVEAEEVVETVRRKRKSQRGLRKKRSPENLAELA